MMFVYLLSKKLNQTLFVAPRCVPVSSGIQ